MIDPLITEIYAQSLYTNFCLIKTIEKEIQFGSTRPIIERQIDIGNVVAQILMGFIENDPACQ